MKIDPIEILAILRDSAYVTGLVIIMMMMIEYFNIATSGNKLKSLQNSPLKQVFLGALLGLIPGCMGGFAAVSLFSHNIFGFGALVAALISDTGDETFVMFASMPKYAIIIKAVTFILAIVTGVLVNLFYKKRSSKLVFDHNLEIHNECSHTEKATGNIIYNIKHMTISRFILLAVIATFAISLSLGFLEHDHAGHAAELDYHESCESHDHNHGHNSVVFGERNLNILFSFIAFIAFFMVLISKEHFLKEHIIEHVIRKHLLRIFLWTFGSLTLIYFLGLFVGFDKWVSENQIIMLIAALIIGLIPQSGPHIIFITLFMQGNIPLSILLANSIVQSGHSGLPLLAESVPSFIKLKSIAIAIGLVIGILGFIFGF